MVRKILLALVIAVIATLITMLLGYVLIALALPIAVTVGKFMTQWATVIGVLAGLYWYLAGSARFGIE